ncbi:MAG TPA: hypothetical protein VN661_12835 [Candidatus Acidoferrales bacterium]|nr:hypothetical protein [Candidatus Acidoferrales bacterium]
MEGERTAAAEAHVRSCGICRGTVEDFEAISAVTTQSADEQAEPSPHVWFSLRAQLEAERIIREPAVAESEGRHWVFLGFPWRVPRFAVASACLAVMAVVSLAASGPIHRRINNRSWMRRTQNSTRPFDAELAKVEKHTVAVLAAQNPLVTASLHHNLAVVDSYIALCEKDVREEPQSELARDYLYGAYQQKAELLADMADRGVDNP